MSGLANNRRKLSTVLTKGPESNFLTGRKPPTKALSQLLKHVIFIECQSQAAKLNSEPPFTKDISKVYAET